ncbi:helix-turn-helix domain-containing protein [Robertkochia solimangrovi]|uniref:helix-turn-helix domain-containing protein n=1 Tax=Robertkochia solimangrovi TaxID=2213046 RepID=UPI00118057FF|nr:helix-turn-helix domain-containing protein [Robertkochia solimangrovi]TRZ45098.1 AraC family transcriptional regulator [Robertkochia solimangrovi]
MSNRSENRSEFLVQAEAIVLENISDENFGVSELAMSLHMSRSNLLRKIKKETELSASQFIRNIRLQEAMTMLKDSSLSVSEISFHVGFGSTSYFIKCFREQYGFPPGEAGKNTVEHGGKSLSEGGKRKYQWLYLAGGIILIIAAVYFFTGPKVPAEPDLIEKSIAVLPFKNESSDSTNLYFVNGLMESTLSNLQKIRDLRVVSRTSSETYRNTAKSIPQIAEELNVNYLVEGSGQRVGNRVVLHIQLIEAATDKPIWVEQYDQEVVDIFDLQNDVARKIAEAIKVVVTPAELAQIEKIPTENMVAYDYFLQALDPFYSRTPEGLQKAIPLFEKATEEDPQFAMAYANLAISYYFLDFHQQQKHYTELINNYADKALLYDSKSDVSLISKALYYMHTEEYRLALPHLEKALEYNPNSNAVVQVLCNLYTSYIPDTAKYLKYALKGIQLDIAANDSVARGYIYLNLSNALIQNGFTDEALYYIDACIANAPSNPYASFLKVYIQYAKDQDLEKAKQGLIKELEKDTTRLDILQETAKLHYFQEDYEGAFRYYEKFVTAKRKYNLDIYPHEDLKIGEVYSRMGRKAESEVFFQNYRDYCQKDESIYKSASMAMLYAHEGKIEEGIEQLKIFATQDHFQYWILLFLEKDPMIRPLMQHPDYKTTIKQIEDRFWDNQEKLRESLEENDLL